MEEDSTSRLYKPHMEAESQNFDVLVQALELGKVDECEPIHEINDSQPPRAPAIVAADGVVGDPEAHSRVDVETKKEGKVEERGGGKRKRGRPPRVHVNSPPSKKKKEKEEEDVCFICFDGGSLVLCDRRGCPKAYHPACIKRDEAFFRSKARWNCGWHICSSCQKAAHYMCYTCTYSLCKGCTKDADYLCVRGNKGFCNICMRTIMLIENNEQGNKETALVDFDDKSSWEYLFKVYWIYLKEKLSLTLSELTQAKNPWKGVDTMAYRGKSSEVHYGANAGKGSISDSSYRHLEANSSKRRKTAEQPELLNKDPISTERLGGDKGTTSIGCTEWASKELLEFVAHMRNGDVSALSQFDVQALLLDYIKQNNLRDPRRKSQIICDVRLENLFGKPCVAHFEMLKLLEFHFLTKEDSQKDVTMPNPGNIIDAILSQAEADGKHNDLSTMGKEKRRKTRRKGEERGPQTNLNEYAAIDAHNINLIYLRRNLMENLIENDAEFHNKVVGSIVRIRICSDQKQDIYRLVQVVGTSKVPVPSETGKRTADVMLEILNLDKEEAIAIDAISNQEFSKDECRRLRQSIKCGLVKRLTVGDIQEKAMALQPERLNDLLETEILRLNHLRDRASEKGHKKELRECVEKLEVLKTPEERQRRLHEIPEVHADSHMDPNYESEEDAREINDKKQDEYVKQRYTGFSKNASEIDTPHKGCDISNDSSGKERKNLTNCEQSRSLVTTFHADKEDGLPRAIERVNESSCNEGKPACGSISSGKAGNHVDSTSAVIGCWDNQTVVKSGSFSEVQSETSTAPFSVGMEPSANDIETDKLWHYRDPNGKIQGPFSMVQLRKWNTTGFFPPDMRIWSIDDKQDGSLLLTDALKGQFHNSVASLHFSLQFQNAGGVSESRLHTCDGQWSGSVDTTGIDGKQKEGRWYHNNAIAHSCGNDEFMRSDGWSSHSSDLTTPVTNCNEVQAGSSQCQDSLKGNNSCSDQPVVHSPPPSSEFPGHSYGTLSHEKNGHESERWNSNPNHGSWTGQSHDIQLNTQGHSDQSSGQNWKPLPVNFSSNKWDSSSGFASMAKSTDSSDQNGEIDILNLPHPRPKTSNEDWEAQAAENKQSMSSDIPVEDSHISDLPSPTPKPIDGGEKGQDAENKQSLSSNFPVQDSGPSWSSASSLVVGSGTQVPEIADERVGYSRTPAKPSVEERDSGLVSQMKPPEAANDHAVSSTIPVEDSHISDLPSPNPKSDEDEKGQAAENSVSSNFPVQDSGRSWSSASSLVVGSGARLPEIADKQGGYSPTPTKPSVEEWDSGLVSLSSLKPPETSNDYDATPASNNDQLTHSSPSHPTSNASSWQTIVTEPIEFSTLAEESVSDLLAEVDAMESQCGLASPTSAMKCDGELIQGSKNDCFGSIEGLSPTTPDLGKSDALSSTGEVQFPSQSAMIDEPLKASQADIFDPLKRSTGKSSKGAAVEGGTKSSDPINHWKASSHNLPPATATVSRGMIDRGTAQRAGPEAMDTDWGTIQGTWNSGWGGLPQGYTNTGWGTGQGTARGNASMNRGASVGSIGRESQPRYGAERFTGQRDSTFQGGNPGFSRGRSSWNWQPSFGGSGGSYSRHPPKGQRVCKFYESGHCKKGASCDYLHP